MDRQERTLIDVVRDALTVLQSPQRNAGTQHVTRVVSFDEDETDIWGIVERGEYGYAAEGINSSTFKPTFARTAPDAEMIPLYFRFHLPVGSDRGILLLQRLGIHGVFTELRDQVLFQFRQHYPRHVLEFGRFVPESIMQALLDGEVRELSVVTHSLPKDLADHVRLKGTQVQVGRVEVRLKAPREKLLFLTQPSWLKRLRRNEAEIVEVFGTDAESVRVWVDYNGRERMYDFKRQNASAPYVDVTSEIQLGKNGHPEFDSIDEYCVGLRDELLQQMGEERS